MQAKQSSVFKYVLASLTLVAILTVAATPASAIGIGPRGGFSFSPDQIVLGGQLELGEITDYILFQPSLDLGFGNDVTVIALNGDLVWHATHLPNTTVGIFLLAGPTIAIFDSELFDSQTDFGISLGGGLDVPLKENSSYSIELRFGIGDIPEIKIVATALFDM